MTDNLPITNSIFKFALSLVMKLFTLYNIGAGFQNLAIAKTRSVLTNLHQKLKYVCAMFGWLFGIFLGPAIKKTKE